MSCPGAARRGASASRSDAAGGADRRFPRSSRLSARKSFLDIYDRGYRVVGAYFVLFGVPGASGRTRLGITVTKKYGDAVRRNRIKRVVRELFRHRRLPGGPLDLVVNVKSGAARAPFVKLDEDFNARFAELLKKVKA